MIDTKGVICKLYETYSIDEIVEFTKVSNKEVIETLIACGAINGNFMEDKEYEIAKELYVSGETLKDVSSLLQFHTKNELRNKLLKDGLLRMKKHKTYVDKNEYEQLKKLAYMYVKAKEGKSLLSITKELDIAYSRIVHICEKISDEINDK